MSSPVLALLHEKLNGENFIKWKSNMTIAFTYESLEFVLVEGCPPEPAINAAQRVRETYEKWIAADKKARAYLLAGMNDVLRLKHEHMATAREMMESLRGMFGQPSAQSKHEAVKMATNAKMKKGQKVADHVLNLINYFTEATTHGAVIDEGTQVSMILESLSPAFLQFKSNYVMNNLVYSLTELLNELKTFEAISIGKVKEEEANVVEEKSSSSKKRKAKGQKGQPKQKKWKSSNSKKKGSSKPKGKCFHCSEDGHWKRNCPKYLAELKEKKKDT